LGSGLLLIFLTAVISGVSTFVNFRAVQGTNVDAFITIRNGVVALMIVPFALLGSRVLRARISRRDMLRLVAIGLLGGAVPFLLFFRGLQMSASLPAANGTFPFRTLFLMAMVLGVVFLKERLSPRLALAAGALLAGNALLLSFTGPLWADGTALVFLATTLWAGEYALSKHTLRTVPSGTVALARMGFGAVFLVGYLGLSGQFSAVPALTPLDWQNLALSAILLAGFVITWYGGLRHVDLSVAASVLVLATPITWTLGILFQARAFTASDAAGVAVIVFGVVLAVGTAALRETWIALARSVRSRLRSLA
jgi:drug/metabolite transporter (DMT)-like permease